MAFSTNVAFSAEPITDPMLIPALDGSNPSITDNSSHSNSSLTKYFSDTYGGGIYHVRDGGSLNIATTSGTKTYSNIAALIELTLTSNPSSGSYTIGDIYEVGRTGGVIYNAGTLTIGNPADASAQALFKGNVASIGGAIVNHGVANIHKAQFLENRADLFTDAPGATYDKPFNKDVWSTADSGRGGAIANFDNKLTITESQFNDNKAGIYGGAIYNGNGGIVELANTNFNGNHAGNDGGAIYNSITDDSPQSASVTIEGGLFDGNTANINGGAIANISTWKISQPANAGREPLSAIIEIKNGTRFINNATNQSGGAIANSNTDYRDINSIVNIDNARFESNGIKRNSDGTYIVNNGGGAISNSGTLTLTNSTLQENFAKTQGGAIYNSGKADISNTRFEDNGGERIVGVDASGADIKAKTSEGGAIYNTFSIVGTETLIGDLTIRNSYFKENVANKGGAISNLSKATIIDTSFDGNSANNGGAIYGGTNSNTTIIAENQDVNFYGSAADDNVDSILLAAGDPRLSAPAGVVNLNAYAGKNVNLGAKVSGVTTSDPNNVPTVNVNYDNANYTGNVNFNGSVSNVNLNVYNGLATVDKAPVSNSTITTKGGTLHFNKDEYFGTDISKAGGHILNNVVLDGGTISVQNGVVSNIAMNSFHLKSDTNIKVDVDLENETMDNLSATNIPSTVIDNGTKLNITSMTNVSNNPNVDEATIFFTDLPNLTVEKIDSPERLNGTIYQYAVQKKSGQQIGLSGGGREDDVFFHFNKLGPSDNVTPKPIAQLGAFLLFDNIYRQSFANMDMLSILTRDERETLKRYNRYSNMFDDEINTFYRDKRQEDYPSAFVRGFTNLEHVRMDHGPKVSNVTYGTLIGHESGLYELGRGWDANYAVFGAYTGAHQTYNGIGVWQNGGSTGGVFTAYKGDFWAGLTANVGGWAVEAHNDFGHEHFPMLGTGVAMKTGYNWRLFDNKFIIQPSYMMSYTFVYAYSHNNAAGVHIKQDPLHAIEFIPGVKLIANNFRNGWQPYLAVNMTWMTMEGGSFWADSAVFDRYTIKPFVEYGIGVQKHHGERSTGYLQAMVRNGGRTGVALTGGFRYAIGEDILD